MNILKKIFRKKNQESKGIFDYFKFEVVGDQAVLLGDFKDKDFNHWLQFVHGQIQSVMKLRPLEGKLIENYVQFTLTLGGQRVDVALIKDGGKGPHELLGELRARCTP